VIGDPGVEHLFDNPVYVRGAMTLQALRNEIGDDAFWQLVLQWGASQSSGHGTTPEFIALAEQISGQQLDALFDTWLFTAEKPPAAASATALAVPRVSAQAQGFAEQWMTTQADRLERGRY
jgi:aminopeptidase N